MSPRFLFALCFLVVAVVMVSAGDSMCPGGTNVCSCRPSAIRPQRQKKPNTCSRCDMPLYSYTDPCVRRRVTVSPAQRQSSRLARLPPAEASAPCSIHPSATIPFSHDDHDCGDEFYYGERKQVSNSRQQENLMSVVDPVSLYLASKNTKSAQKVDEAKISYGFYKEPNQPEVEEEANVKEAALNTIAKRVLVLKQEPKKSKFAVDPVSCEEEDEPQKPKSSAPTYNDLGYTTYNSNPCPCPFAKGPGFQQGTSMSYSFPPQQSVQRYESRCSHERTGETFNSHMSYFNF